MRTITQWFVILGPLLILLVDFVVWRLWGYEVTITAVVRDWHGRSAWPEALYVVGAVVLYLHLYRGLL